MVPANLVDGYRCTVSKMIDRGNLLPQLSCLRNCGPAPFLKRSREGYPSSFCAVCRSPFLSLTSPPVSTRYLCRGRPFRAECKRTVPSGRNLSFILFRTKTSTGQGSAMFRNVDRTPSVRPPLLFLPVISFLSERIIMETGDSASCFSLCLQ